MNTYEVIYCPYSSDVILTQRIRADDWYTEDNNYTYFVCADDVIIGMFRHVVSVVDMSYIPGNEQ